MGIHERGEGKIIMKGLRGTCIGFSVWAAMGCGTTRPGEEAVGSVTEALAPAGSGARFVSVGNLPSALFPGERRLVSVTMQNIGAASPANDWTMASPVYDLLALSSTFGWTNASLPATVPVGTSASFAIVITAPAISDAFTAQMNAEGLGVFGDIVSVPVSVSPAITPQWGCTFVPSASTVPTVLAPGESRVITVTVLNTGFETWPATGMRLVTEDTPPNLWSQTASDLSVTIPPGAAVSFSLGITAPVVPGTYSLQREMNNGDSVGDFRLTQHCVSSSITVSGTTIPLCGNGVVDSGEECDDGNLANGDGCSVSCTVETLCGNGVLNGGEQCDDGNSVAGDGCSPTCTLEPRCKDGHGPPPRRPRR
jgi:cysteine-rich repeat protein